MRTLNGALDDANSLQTGPNTGDGSTTPLGWAKFHVNLATDGKLSIDWKGQIVLTNFQTGYFPSEGRLVFVGRTGGANENHHIDNIRITTYPAAGPIISAIQGTPSGFVIILDARGITVDTNKPIALKFDGVTVTPTAIYGDTTATGLHRTLIKYITLPQYLVFGSTHSITLTYVDSNTTSTTTDRTFTVGGYPFDWLDQNAFTIEAEDFDFDGGQFIDNPVLASAPAPNNYMDRIGIQNVDRGDPTEGGAAHTYRAYDSASGTGEIVGTELCGDVLRKKYADAQMVDPSISDFNVGWVDDGEWWNYTRTFPAGKYRIYARLSRDGTPAILGRFDIVLSGANTANQVLAPLGMVPARGTSGWQVYSYFPMVDLVGNEVVVLFIEWCPNLAVHPCERRTQRKLLSVRASARSGSADAIHLICHPDAGRSECGAGRPDQYVYY
jgi:hypothetical protein